MEAGVRATNSPALLFILPKTTEFGGLERHLLDFVTRLPDGLQVVIACFAQDNISERLGPQLRSRVRVQCGTEPESFAGWLHLIWGTRPGIVVFCYNWIKAFSWKAPLAVAIARVPRRFCIQHSFPPAPPPPSEGWLPLSIMRRVIGRRARHLLVSRASSYFSHKTICVSEAVRRSLINDYGFSARKTVTVHNGVCTAQFAPSTAARTSLRERLDIGPQEFTLVCTTRLAEAKGVEVLLRTLAEVMQRGISCKCIIVGDGPLKQDLARLAQSLDLPGKVFFEGFQNDVRPYLQAADAFILTSHVEGLPLSVLEAMACGLPCIVTDVGGTSEAVEQNVTGLVVPPTSVEAIADAIERLATHPEERDRMALKGRDRVREWFEIDERMRELAEVIVG